MRQPSPISDAVTLHCATTMSLKDSVDVDAVARVGLEKLGYKQEMTRSRGLVHILFMTLAIMAVPYGLAAPIATSLVGGGPAVMIWGWILVSILTQTLALSLAEICSKYPTSAGAYYWCYRLGSPHTRVLASWINGWLTVVGVWTIALSVTFGTAQLIVAGAGIYHPEWTATAWQTYMIFLGVTAVACLFCLFFNKHLPAIDIICACWTGLGIIVILICVSVKAAAGRHSISFALGHFDASYSGWTPGWSFFIGTLPPAYTYSAIGMITNMAEEVHNPSEILPKAITWSIPIGTLSGIVFLLPILFTLPDIETLLQVSSGQPIGVMFTLIMGSKAGGFGLWFIVFGIGMFCAISISCAASRATWAFARDKAIPFHQLFSKISPYLDDVPVNALLLSTVIQILLGLIYLGSTAAFNAFVGVAVMCLGASYAMPVAMSLMNARRDMHDAPFNLGRFGTVINAVAVLWIMFAMVLFSMPAVIPVTRVSMNYASVVFVGFGVISAVWYLINGRFHYTGPPIPEESAASSESNRSTSPLQG
ncbi:amino acid transporter [Suillus fuscotomentosus]|uniref:Amino acid transporter n=1 Tax=Suillus fuscotomentosus TaxID=1912939 RepID=A0AAD4E344_9AGAM|nr:amino acid transporter [Suillus fuscotomentosus]KAG1898854.1 amino acid transporter [Suillus fuscotomentosus]